MWGSGEVLECVDDGLFVHCWCWRDLGLGAGFYDGNDDDVVSWSWDCWECFPAFS